MASLTSSQTMIKALILSLIAQGNFSYSFSIVHDINAFKSNMYTTDQQQCQSIIGHAWQCWARFGKNYPMCSDIIRRAWQCSGQGFKIDFQALDMILTLLCLYFQRDPLPCKQKLGETRKSLL